MPRYEHSDGTTDKFWEIHQDDASLTLRYGRLGAAGLSSTKTFAGADEAREEAETLIAAKLQQGYLAVDGDVDEASEDAGPRHPELEAAIWKHPDDEAAWTAYADWLTSVGDTRGELLLLAGQEDGATRFEQKRIERRRREIEDPYIEEWMGPVLDELFQKCLPWPGFDEVLQIDWHAGFIIEARISSVYEWPGPELPEIYRAVARSPASRFLARLAFGNVLDDDGEADYGELVKALVGLRQLPAMRHLHIGDFDYPGECEISWANVGDVSEVYDVVPNLETLHLQGAGIHLGQLTHARLKTLKLETGGLPEEAVRAVAAADLPELEDLEVWFGQDGYGAGGDVDMLWPIFAGQRFPKLRRLALVNSEFSDDIAAAIAEAPILDRIRVLDRSMGTLSDRGARHLLAAADRLRRLELVDLAENYVCRLRDDLARALPNADVSGQEEPESFDGKLHYYTSVGE